MVAVVAAVALSQHKSGKVSGSRKTVFNTIASSPSPSGVAHTPSSSSHKPSTSSSSSSSSRSSSSPSTPSAGKQPLIVLNDTTTTGLARDAAQQFTQGGWQVTSSGNLPQGITDIVSTCAYYDPNRTGAEQAAQDLQKQYPAIKRVRPRFDQLPSGPVVVVLTSDYSAG